MPSDRALWRRCRVLAVLVALGPAFAARSQEKPNLIEQYNRAVELVNGDRFEEGRRALAEALAAAKKIQEGDPQYRNAQQVIRLAPDLLIASYQRSAVKSQVSARSAANAAQMEKAVAHWRQAESDFVELLEKKPDDQSFAKSLQQVREQLAQARVLAAYLKGDAPTKEARGALGPTNAKEILEFAPSFSLPLWDKPELISLGDFTGSPVVVQLLRAGGEEAALAAATLKGLLLRFGGNGLKAVSLPLDDADASEAVASFVQDHGVTWPVVLDDFSGFRRQYVPQRYYLPAHVLITADRRALWIDASDPLESCLAICRAVETEFSHAGSARALVGPSSFYAAAESFLATDVTDESDRTIHFSETPALLLVTNASDRSEYVQRLSAVAERYDAARLQVMAVVNGPTTGAARDFAEANRVKFPVFLGKSYLPDAYGPNVLRFVLVSAGGRVVKVLPIVGGVDYRALLDKYAEMLAGRSYPREADEAPRVNLARSVNGGRVAEASAAAQGAPALLLDGDGQSGWIGQGAARQELVLSFLDGEPVAFDRVVLENAAQKAARVKDFELLVGAGTQYRSLGRFRLEERAGPQAFDVPVTRAESVKLRLLTGYADPAGNLGLGEVAVLEDPGAKPGLLGRLAERFRRGGFADRFDAEDLTFWEQSDFASFRPRPRWQVEGGKLQQTGAPLVEYAYRSTALLAPSDDWGDFRFEATVSGRSLAAGLLFGFVDWNNFYRVLLLEGQHPQTQAPVGNSIRLERWRDGRAEVLGLHGESFALDQPIRLEVLRAGRDLAVKAQGKVILRADVDEGAAGRLGLFAAGSNRYLFDDVRIVHLPAGNGPALPAPNALSTAAGGSIAWLNSQGAGPEGWASNLLREAVFSQPGAWRARKVGREHPEAVFAFRGGGELLLREIAFALPAEGGSVAPDAARAVEVLASRGPRLSDFQPVGTFPLRPTAGLQRFSLPNVACRYLKIVLRESADGENFSLARVVVGAAGEPDGRNPDVSEREDVQRRFATPAGNVEQENNDDLQRATPLTEGASTEALIASGERDLFELPRPPSEGAALSLKMDALPWLRFNAEVLDRAGKPVPPPAVDSDAAQSVTRYYTGSALQYVRVQMPDNAFSLVVDTSGSMAGREDDLQQAVSSFLEGVKAREEVEVIRFSQDVERVAPFSNDAAQLAGAVQGKLRANGATALYDAMIESLDSLAQRRGNQAVVLLSDGMNTAGRADFALLCRRLRDAGVPVYVIGLGVDLHQYDAASGNTALQLLRNLARQSGGRFFFAPTAGVLERLYEEIAAELRSRTRYRILATWDRLPQGDRSSELLAGADGARAPEVLGPVGIALPTGASELLSWSAGPSFRRRPVPIGEVPQLGAVEVTYVAADAEQLLPPALLPAFELILDSSYSMSAQLGERPKYQIAQQVTKELLAALPDSAQVGLRLYGHWGPWLPQKTDPKAGRLSNDDPRLNTDSDLVVAFGALRTKHRVQMQRWIDWARPRGKTPLVYSLLESQSDFPAAWRGPKTVILVSDGQETCGGKLEDVADAFRGGDVGVVVHVVGFDIEGTEAERQLEEIARSGGGNYYAAKDSKALAKGLRTAIQSAAFVALDETGRRVVARGLINGPAVELAPGTYRLAIQGFHETALPVRVVGGVTATLQLNEAGELVLTEQAEGSSGP